MDKRVVDSSLPWIIEWLWVPLWVAVLGLFERFFSLSRRVTRLETLEEQRKNQHKETMESLSKHNDAVLGEVRTLGEQVKGNGRRLGVIEAHLISRGKD